MPIKALHRPPLVSPHKGTTKDRYTSGIPGRLDQGVAGTVGGCDYAYPRRGHLIGNRALEAVLDHTFSLDISEPGAFYKLTEAGLEVVLDG